MPAAPRASPQPGRVARGLKHTYGGGQGLLVPLEGAEPGGDFQQGDSAQLRAAAEDAPVVLQAQAGEGLVADLARGERRWHSAPMCCPTGKLGRAS